MEGKKYFYGNTKFQFGPATLEEQGFCFDRGGEANVQSGSLLPAIP